MQAPWVLGQVPSALAQVPWVLALALWVLVLALQVLAQAQLVGVLGGQVQAPALRSTADVGCRAQVSSCLGQLG